MNTLRIVHCAHFSESKYGAVYYAIDRKLSNGLIRNGHFVYDFSYREIAKNSTFFKSKKFGIKKLNTALLETLSNIEPDLLLLGHSELISFETLKEAKRLYPNMKIAMWWVDWIYNLHSILERLPLLDRFFITSDPQLLKNHYSDPELLHKCVYLPNFCDTSIDSYKAFESSTYLYDVLFIGRADKERAPFISFLRDTFSHIKLGIFGQTKESLITGVHYLKTIGSSKIGINYNRNNALSLYSSDRIIHLLANGTLVFSPKIPNFNTIFSEEEVIYFNDYEDCKEKITYYLTNVNQRKQISQMGHAKAHRIFNEKRITQFLLESTYELPFTEVYEWVH